MAVIKLKYTRSLPKIKAHLRYITHRPDREGERQTRLLFGRDALTDKQEAYQFLDDSKPGRIFFKLILSTNPKREDKYKDLDLQAIYRKTLRTLEARLGRPLQFVAAIHNDHTQIRHVHGIFVMHGRLTKADSKLLRDSATQEAQSQRRMLDQARENLNQLFRDRGNAERQPKVRSVSAKTRMCPECGVIQGKFAFECFNCGLPLHRGVGSQRKELHLA